MHFCRGGLRLLLFLSEYASSIVEPKENNMNNTATADALQVATMGRHMGADSEPAMSAVKASLLERVLAPRSEHIYATLRIVIGAMLAFHGMQKVLGVLATHQPPVMSQMWIGGALELSMGMLIAFGLFTRAAAFLASGMMAVAYTQFHWKFQFDANFFPALNHGELAVMYSFVLLFFAAKGPGTFSIDQRRAR